MIKLIATLFISFLFVSSPEYSGYTVGDKATDFNLKGVDGKIISMSANLDNKGYIVIFTCNTCPYSVAYEDRVIALHNKYMPHKAILLSPSTQMTPWYNREIHLKICKKELKKRPSPFHTSLIQLRK